ncbi:M1 family metallopeptidase [Flavobacterium rakeshii]|uniref:M1 family metallopeptidase n=1 Tax=Flavobacterium rakeshii TaxID=1038845 RepID=UPI002E7BF09B|nr:M1 family metallopeptidase [Flavobacterium rakeshii]MEE1899990.1 M1 family metallopeptidase [Flavobacterium rakeshii]
MKNYISVTIFLLSLSGFAQQYKKADFKTLNAYLTFDVPHKKIMGKVKYTFDLLEKTDTITIDAHDMDYTNVTINGKKADFVDAPHALKLYKGYKKGKNILEFNYTAQPKQTLYFVGEGDGLQIWTQGQGKYTSHWLPSFDDMNEKVVFNLSVGFQEGFEVLANGELKGKSSQGNLQKWNYEMQNPMSSYLLMMAIGRFEKQQQMSASGTPLEFYYRPEDRDKFEPTYRYSKQIFDFFEKEIGVKYVWGIYRQIPVLDFLYAGMENTTSTIFSQDYVVDNIGFNDRTYVNVNAHELAHQWFGDLITAKSGEHHWLQEGFATYYALLAEQELYGEDHFYYELYQMAERLQQASQTDTVPILNEKASALSYYQKGAWALHVLREGVGHDAFRKAVKTYLEKYAFQNVSTDDFLAEINKVSDYDTESFKKRWLENPKFEVGEAIELLNKNKFIQQYFAIGSLQSQPFKESKEMYTQVMNSDSFWPLKEEILFQLAEVPFEEKADIVRTAMKTDNIKIRQAVARTVVSIPDAFFEEYKSLMQDESYVTKEIALNVLSMRFPDRIGEFLDMSDTWVGFNDKNLRILWLTLAYTTKDYRADKKEQYYAELQDYASPNYESSIRQNALSNLIYIGKQDDNVLINLARATKHHKWQFAKFGRDNIRKLLKEEGYREAFTNIMPELKENERQRLELLLAE